jgi:hypothetical protein
MARRTSRRLKAPPQKTRHVYRQLWRVVDGAVRDALETHPEYLTPKGNIQSAARRSIVKRVTGAVLGFAEESAKGAGDIAPSG